MSMPDSSTSNSSNASKPLHTLTYASSGTSPTRFAGLYATNTVQRTAASGYSPVDRSSVKTFPGIDSAEFTARSKTLPLPHADKFPAENSIVARTGGATDSAGDAAAAFGATPKALSREELADTDLDVGSMVEFDIASERHYGVIRWIGYLFDKGNVIVGIELVSF